MSKTPHRYTVVPTTGARLLDESDDVYSGFGAMAAAEAAGADEGTSDPADVAALALVIEDTGDGGAIIDIGESGAGGHGRLELPQDLAHDANLALYLEDSDLNGIAGTLLESIKDDLHSRSAWRERFAKGLKALGLSEDTDAKTLFEGASTVVHPLLAEAAVQFQARAMAELFPPSGPVKGTLAPGVPRSEGLLEQAERVQDYMNYHLTEVLEDYADELDQLLFYLPLSGSAFKKCYRDPVTGVAESDFLAAEDVIVPYAAKSLKDAQRITHRVQLSPNEMRKQQVSGFYLDVGLTPPSDSERDRLREEIDKADGREPASSSEDDRHTVYECHCEIDLPAPFADPDEIARPYIIAIDLDAMKVLSIRRNWRADDEALKRKRTWFVHYCYVPGLGFYGFGLIHLIGGLSKAATGALRSLLDAAAFANLPASAKLKGVRTPGGRWEIAPGESIDIDSNTDDIRKAIMPFPYKEPSRTLFELMGFLVKAGQRFASTTEVNVGDAASTGPVGTTVALIEQGSKVYSGIHGRLHRAQKREFRLLSALLAEGLQASAGFAAEGAKTAVTAADFDGRVDIVPVSDPKIFSQTQRIAIAQAEFQLANAAPDLHDRREVYRRMYAAIGAEQIDDILLDPEAVDPLDPISENMAILTGRPVRAFDWEDHASHIAVHMAFMSDPGLGGNLKVAQLIGPVMTAHLAEHLAYQYRAQMMAAMGTAGLTLPELPRQRGKRAAEPPLAPEVQNAIARAAAKAVQQMSAQQGPAAAASDPAPGHDPTGEMARARVAGDLQIAGQKAAAELALKGETASADARRKDRKAAMDAQLRAQKLQADIAREDAKMRAEIARKDAQAGRDDARENLEAAAGIAARLGPSNN